MYELNKKIKNLKPYEPMKGNFSIRLDANESCFNLPQYMKDKIFSEISKVDFNRYPDPLATDVCKAFADYYGISPDNVTAGNGSDELISIITQTFMMSGETLITTEPDFSMYRFYGELAELNCVAVEKNKDLSINVDRLIKSAQDNNARCILFSNPCNPTSVGILRKDIIKLVESVDALVVLDEAYMDFWEESILDLVNDYDNLIILRTASKAVGAAALRLGFAVSNTTNTNAFRAVKSPYNVNSISQIVGTIIYSDVEYLQNVRKTIVSLRKKLYNELKAVEAQHPDILQVVDGCCNFVYIKSCEAVDIFKYMISQKIAIRFMGGFIRISTGTNEENKELIRVLKEYFK